MEIERRGRVKLTIDQQAVIPMGEISISRVLEFKTSIAEWKGVLGLTNYQIILLPNELIEELESLRRRWGFWKIDDVIAKFLKVYRGERIEITQQFLARSMRRRL
jgi:hypothetical protein